MIYREFQDLELSGLGLGMMRLPTVGGDASVIDEKATAEMVAYAMENGINYYDTAWGYHNGNSELAAGRILSKYPRESYYLASKFPGYDNSNMPKVKEIFEEQLKKCQTTYFDFYLIHNVYEGNVDDYLDPKFGILDYLLEQKKNGRIRHFGFSVHGSLEVLQKFMAVYGEYMEFCQLQLNYMDWHFQKCDEKVALCKKWNLPIWVMEPLRGGKISTLSDDMTAVLKEKRPQETVPGWAFRFLQAIPEVKMVLSGMSDMNQLKANIETWKEDRPLSQEEFDWLVARIDEEVKRVGVPCTACRYCTGYCPQKLPIPELIELFNGHKIAGGGLIVPKAVAKMEESKRPANCIGCKSCEQVCPQQIRISEIMKEFSKMIGM